MQVARTCFDHVAAARPDLYEQMLTMIRPHSLEAVLFHFQHHLEQSCPDLSVLTKRNVPTLCFEFVRAIVRHFPTPGDAFGIHLTCRITKVNTQGTLDSKHLQSSTHHEPPYNVEKKILNELTSLDSHAALFEIVQHKHVATIFTSHTRDELIERLPEAGVLERGGPENKTRDGRYLNTFSYFIVQDRVLYRTAKDLEELLHRLSKIEAFSDIRYVHKRCGVLGYFFNVANIVQRLYRNRPTYAKDVMTVVKYQCRTGTPLPLTRDGLMKDPERSPVDVFSFEAPKQNYARYSTTQAGTYPVQTSGDKIMFGQQFNEGTGYFGLRHKK